MLSEPYPYPRFSSIQAVGTGTEVYSCSLLPARCSQGGPQDSFSCFLDAFLLLPPRIGAQASRSAFTALHYRSASLSVIVQSIRKTNRHFCWPCFYLFFVLNRGANDTSSISKNQKVKQIFRRPRCYMLYLT